MIYFDTTKSGKARHRSGLVRVNGRLREGLGEDARPVVWPEVGAAGRNDWWFTCELFSEEERPGLAEFLHRRQCRAGAVYYDAIPLRHPRITWAHSVARHPGYLKLLAQFDRVWAISQASRDELLGYWRWLGLAVTPPVELLPMGADFNGRPRVVAGDPPPGRAQLLCVGILEPRKNQTLLLDVCETLWAEGLDFELHLVGRVNPFFGRPIAERAYRAARTNPRLRYHEAASDDALAALYAQATVTVCPTLAEGCGLPLLESLWAGVPCVASDLPALREGAMGGGCVLAAVNDRTAWTAALRRVLTEAGLLAGMREEARSRMLPTWAESVAVLRTGLARG